MCADSFGAVGCVTGFKAEENSVFLSTQTDSVLETLPPSWGAQSECGDGNWAAFSLHSDPHTDGNQAATL